MIKLKIAIAIVAGFFFATTSLLDMRYGTQPSPKDMRNALVAWTATQKLKPVQRINHTGKGDRYVTFTGRLE